MLKTLEEVYPQKIKAADLVSKLIFKNESRKWLAKAVLKNKFFGYQINVDAVKLLTSAKEAGLVKYNVIKEGEKKDIMCVLTTAGYGLLNQTRIERLTKFSAFSIVILTFSLITITLMQSYLNSIGYYGLILDSQIIYFILLSIAITWWILQPQKRVNI